MTSLKRNRCRSLVFEPSVTWTHSSSSSSPFSLVRPRTNGLCSTETQQEASSLSERTHIRGGRWDGRPRVQANFGNHVCESEGLHCITIFNRFATFSQPLMAMSCARGHWSIWNMYPHNFKLVVFFFYICIPKSVQFAGKLMANNEDQWYTTSWKPAFDSRTIIN